ncbi:MAG: YraN family protein [Planctomycetes bacterium]|nr:YraN family protein [Planctomycetota bacterium]
MADPRKKLGKTGEDLAVKVLEEAGYVVIERNLAIGGGELDIVARHQGEIVFVEVKCRQGSAFGSAAGAITSTKAQRIARAARAYLSSRRLTNFPSRCDVVAVDLQAQEGRAEIFPSCIDLAGALAGQRWRG